MKKEYFYSLFFIVISILLFAFFISPKQSSIAYLNKKILNQKSQLDVLERYSNELFSVLERVKGYEEELKRIEMAIPEDPLIPLYLHMLQKYASQSGLLLKDIGFPVIQTGDTEGVENTTESETSSLPPKLKRWSTTISLAGNYSSLKSFVETLERSLRLTKIERISISEGENFQISISFFSY